MNSEVKEQKSRIDWMITLMPLAIIVALCVVFFVAPDQSNAVLSKVRFFFGVTGANIRETSALSLVSIL